MYADIVGKDIHKSWRPVVAEMGGFGILFGFIIGMFSGIYMHDLLTFPLVIVLVVILLVGIIGIADEPVETLNDFYAHQHASPYPLYRDAKKEMWMRYGIHAVPTLMLLDKDGYIKRVWSGAPTEYMIEQILKDVLD